MKGSSVFIATIISVTFWISIAPAGDQKDVDNDGLQQIAVQNAIATIQIAEAIEEFKRYSMGDLVSIGVLSTGVDKSMLGLKRRVLPGASFVLQEPDIVDRNGIGTHNAALIAAIAPNARILPIKVLDRIGIGAISLVVKGIHFGVERRVKILLIPGGRATRSNPGLKEAVARARQKGILLIASAGNMRSTEQYYPGAFKEVLAVGATNAWDRKAAFSNFGDWVSLFAPWMDFKSVYKASQIRSLCESNPEAAIVAGVAALVLGINPGLGADDVEEILLSTATDISGKNPEMGVGARRVNALAAVRAAKVWGR